MDTTRWTSTQRLPSPQLPFCCPASVDTTMWSLSLATQDYAPTTAEAARIFAREAEQVLTSIGNLWIIWRTVSQTHHIPPEDIVNHALINLSAVVECMALCASGRDLQWVKKESASKGLARLPSAFQGCDGMLVRILRGAYSRITHLSAVYSAHEPAIKTLAGHWEEVRNAIAHRPVALNRAVVDRGSIGRPVPLKEATEAAQLAFALARDICDREQIVELNALPI
jgi:hypothetical protein